MKAVGRNQLGLLFQTLIVLQATLVFSTLAGFWHGMFLRLWIALQFRELCANVEWFLALTPSHPVRVRLCQVASLAHDRTNLDMVSHC